VDAAFSPMDSHSRVEGILWSDVMKILTSLAMAALVVMGAAGASAQTKGWETWTKGEECFALLGMAADNEAPVRPFGRPYIAIKNAPKLDNFNGVVIVSGYGDETGEEGTIDVDGKEFSLLIFKGAGFVRSGEPEERLVAALEQGKEARVTWLRKDGMIVQNYRLEGFPVAKKTIDAACPKPGAKPAAAEAAAKPETAKVKR